MKKTYIYPTIRIKEVVIHNLLQQQSGTNVTVNTEDKITKPEDFGAKRGIGFIDYFNEDK